jgi:transcriptional regulator with GAF, ATPase, and Fis domain
VESELFGREKGAFTGALNRQVGRFELADGATLFLDEIGEMPIDTQSKLLRVLQAGEFERLGSPRTIKVDVRVIVATNRDLLAEVEQGRFRRDLYYRLNVFPLTVPPLRERIDDIPQLVWEFVNELGEKMGKKIRRIANDDMRTLMAYPWPGNVRELRNIVEHAMIVSRGDRLEIDCPRAVNTSVVPGGTLEEVERRHIEATLIATGGRIKGPGAAAQRLGLNPSTLYSRMRKLGIRQLSS